MKAIALLSGGLDSTLAVRLIKEQGIEIIALNLKTPFCLCDRGNSAGCGSYSRKAAQELGIEFRVVNVAEEFLPVLKNPKYGYGSNMNPCIDCRILSFSKAREHMAQTGARFVITGEVLGQRPMSQHKQALETIERESGLKGLVLRPLSARLLAETIPEREGWVDRNRLLDICGRGRRSQIGLAKNLDIKDYPCAAGGCLLTDPEFSKRIRDLIAFSELNVNNVELLKIGRHFRLSSQARFIVGRDEQENMRLTGLAKDDDYLFRPFEVKGPFALGRGIFDEDKIKSCGAITSRYCDLDGSDRARIIYRRLPLAKEYMFEAVALDENSIKNLRI